MRVIWSRAALLDRETIFDHIAVENFTAAAKNDDKIAAIGGQLSRFPQSGRRGRLSGTRELVITDTPYIAIYRADLAAVTVLGIIHGAQQWPPAE